jgi:pyridoxine 4-dehydrogenase
VAPEHGQADHDPPGERGAARGLDGSGARLTAGPRASGGASAITHHIGFRTYDTSDLEAAQSTCDLGINLIDTADSYGPFVSERLIADALHPYPDDLVIATKGGLTRSGPNQWRADGRPQHLRAACDGSLERLKLDQIPVYQLHRVDPQVPLEDSIGMLVRLKDEGKIRHIGVCNVDDDELTQVLALTPIVSVQNRYGHGDRSSEAIVDRCEVEALGFFPWAPLGGGSVADATVARIAEAHDATPRQVALTWLLARSPVILPIPGTSSVGHLEENVFARELVLTPHEIAELNRM